MKTQTTFNNQQFARVGRISPSPSHKRNSTSTFNSNGSAGNTLILK